MSAISFPKPAPPKDGLSPAAKSLWLLRNALFDKIRSAKVKWWDVKLANGLCKIKVCSPVYVLGDHATGEPGKFYYVPVTARETYELAKYFGAFPLTRAVADQLYNQAEVKVGKPPGLDAGVGNQGYDFPKASAYYHQQYTTGEEDSDRYAGGHKLWILSSAGTSINHGFYETRSATSPAKNAGCLDNHYWTIQDLGPGHPEEHWDYSQLLQLMKEFTGADGTPLSTTLVQALKDTNPAIWDEGKGKKWYGFDHQMEDRLTKA
jgi:hypothetical protein